MQRVRRKAPLRPSNEPQNQILPDSGDHGCVAVAAYLLWENSYFINRTCSCVNPFPSAQTCIVLSAFRTICTAWMSYTDCPRVQPSKIAIAKDLGHQKDAKRSTNRSLEMHSCWVGGLGKTIIINSHSYWKWINYSIFFCTKLISIFLDLLL